MKKLFMLMVGLLFWQGVMLAGEEKWVKLSGKTESITPSSRVFSDLRYLKQDKWGNVFAVDEKESVVVKYDSSLKFVTAFGRKGQGPGEFTALPALKLDILQVAPNGDVWIADFNPDRFVVFTNDGKPKAEKRLIELQPTGLNRNIHSHFPLTDQLFAAYILTNKANGFRQDPLRDILLIGVNPLKVLFRQESEEKRINFYYEGTAVIGIKEDYFGDCGKIITDGLHTAIMWSQKYEIIVFDNKTGKSLIIKKDVKKVEFSDTEMEMLRQTYKKKYDGCCPGLAAGYLDYLRPRKNVLMGVHFSRDKVFVFPVLANITDEKSYPADIWTKQGVFIERIHFPFAPAHIYEDWVYRVTRDENDNPVIVRWKMIR